MSPVIISAANQKGGVAKTTTITNLAFNMTLPIFDGKSRKVLVIDVDPQANCNDRLSLRPDIEKEVTINDTGIYGVLRNELKMNDKMPLHTQIVNTPYKNLDIVPGTGLMEEMKVEITSANYPNQYKVLKNAIKKSWVELEKYDYILIDNRPAIDIVTMNTFATSHYVLIPTTTSSDDLKGLGKTINSVNRIKDYEINNDLEILGVLITRIDSRTNKIKEFEEKFKDLFGLTFMTNINSYTAFANAENSRLPMFVYDPNSKGSAQYISFTAEVLSKTEDDFTIDNLQNAFDHLDSIADDSIREDSYLYDEGDV